MKRTVKKASLIGEAFFGNFAHKNVFLISFLFFYCKKIGAVI